jgi:DNA processing protein
MSDIRFWIGLSLIPDIGPVLSRRLIDQMKSPDRIFHAGTGDLCSIKGMRRDTADNIKNFRLWNAIENHVKVMEQNSISVVPFNDSRYPETLKELPDAPIVLYMKGNIDDEDRFAISIVGSRKLTPYGEAVTQRLSSELASAGFTIISGMARGIDTLAHKSALASGGRTIAVLGSGLDICYPAENKGLMNRITSSGCVISEFPPGTMPNRENFPRRNRLISGLSLGVLVVEATATSGSLITAKQAIEQNKEVFAVPGNITSPNAEGTNRLIQQGARIVLNTENIIEELAPVLRGFIRAREREIPLTDEENNISTILTREPKHIDMLSRESGLPPHKILGLLLSLELKGIARQSSGKKFYLP